MSRAHATLVLAFAAASLLSGTGCASRTLTDNPEPHARSVVLLLDASASMRENDPEKVTVAGASLALALAGRHDNVGVLAYNERVEVLVPLRPTGDAAARAEAVSRVASIGRSGATDFSPVLDCAEIMLDVAQAPRGSCAIFLTDGLPTGRISRRREFNHGVGERALEVPDAVARIAARGWRIFAIALGPEAPGARPYLTQLVAPTGGAVFEAKDASSLVDVFQAVSVQALGYLSAETQSSVQVPPETRRLAFLASSPGGTATVGAITRDGKPDDAAKVIRTPAGSVAAALLEEPEPGSYQADLGGSRGAALLESGWGVELEPGSPPPSVQRGARVPVAVSVHAGDAAIAKQVGDRVRLSLEVRSAGEVVASGTLNRVSGGLRFEGSFMAPDKDDTLTLDVAATLDVFTSHRSISIAVAGKAAAPAPPPRALALDVSPSRCEFTGFAGEGELHATLTVRGDPQRGTRVTLDGLTGFSVSPTSLELAPGKSGTVEVHGGPSDKSAGGRLVLTATPLAPDAGEKLPPSRIDVPVSSTRATIALAKLDLGEVLAGDLVKATIEGENVNFSVGILAGPGSAKLPVVVEPSRDPSGKPGYVVAVRAPVTAAAGDYTGELVARAGSSSKPIPVTVAVTRPKLHAPEKLTIQASWGWSTTRFELEGATAGSVSCGALGLEPSGMASISPDLDIRTTEVSPGHYELRVFLAASLPPGRYMGWLKADLAGEKKEIPIILEVKR